MNGSFMGRMTIGATHPAFRHRMMAGEIKLAPDIAMTLIAESLDRPGRLDSQARPITVSSVAARSPAKGGLGFAARLCMQAGGAVAGFAAGIDDVGALGNQTGRAHL